jgi:hypothetical protein
MVDEVALPLRRQLQGSCGIGRPQIHLNLDIDKLVSRF